MQPVQGRFLTSCIVSMHTCMRYCLFLLITLSKNLKKFLSYCNAFSQMKSVCFVAIVLDTDFLTMATETALGDSWTGRVSIRPRGNQAQLVSLIFYVYNEGEGEMAYAKTADNIMEEIYGHTPEVGGVRLVGVPPKMSVS